MTSEALAAVVDELRAIVGASNVRTGEAVGELDPGQHPANLGAGIVVAPGSTDEVAQIVRLCGANGVSIVSHGGRTGLVGGGISRKGQIVLSLRRMDAVESLVPYDRVAIVQAGCTLQALQDETSTSLRGVFSAHRKFVLGQ